MPSLKLTKLLRANATETWLIIVLVIICLGLSLSSDKFFTIANLFNLLNTSSTNLIFAVGLLVVLIAGGIDISFAVDDLVEHGDDGVVRDRLRLY